MLSRRKDIGWVTLGRKEAEEFVDKPRSLGFDDELGPFGVHLNTCLNVSPVVRLHDCRTCNHKVIGLNPLS